ncbi:hypothetical protein K523DRAFT_415368 [Schizophyllum commune Tattone D]|nr:hypothetical protein K523DRAFT_415368 [Schizophyllum commune Tattone D]
MGRRQRKDIDKPKVIDYTLSQGHIGRNPGPTAAEKVVQRTGYATVIPGNWSVSTAHAGHIHSPTYPGAYVRYRLPVACRNRFLSTIRNHRAGSQAYYGVTVQTNIVHTSSKPPRETVNAHGLVDLNVNGEDLTLETQRQFAQTLDMIDAPDLVHVRFSFIGPLPSFFHRSILRLLVNAGDTLTHLSLSMTFRSERLLRDYLYSPKAVNLVSLEIESAHNVQDCILEALMCPQSHCLRNLRRLCLRIKDLEVDLLFSALWQRHHWSGVTGLNRVEVVEEVDPEIRQDALAMGITFGEPDIFRHV